MNVNDGLSSATIVTFSRRLPCSGNPCIPLTISGLHVACQWSVVDYFVHASYAFPCGTCKLCFIHNLLWNLNVQNNRSSIPLQEYGTSNYTLQCRLTFNGNSIRLIFGDNPISLSVSVLQVHPLQWRVFWFDEIASSLRSTSCGKSSNSTLLPPWRPRLAADAAAAAVAW